MEQNTINKGKQTSDQVDMEQLLQLFNRASQRVFRGILRLFLYLKRHFLIFSGLILVGLIIGYGLSQIVTKKLKTEVIVKPYIESKNYLYDVINEIQANLHAEDSTFFAPMGIEMAQLKGLEVSIEPVGQKEVTENLEDELKYLEVLEKFQNTDFVSDVLLSEIYNKSTLNHKITFTYKDREEGFEATKKLMSYINSNSYFNEVVKIGKENAESRIEGNEMLIEQIDKLIASYSERMTDPDNSSAVGKFVVGEDQPFDVTSLLSLKNALMKDSEKKRLELLQLKDPINILHFGMPQQVQKEFFGRKIVLVPILLVLGYLLFSIGKYLNQKADKML